MSGKERTRIEELAEERGIDDAGSLYPHRMTGYKRLRRYGRMIVMKDYHLSGRAAKLFAQCYASAYENEIDVFDRDECYEYYGLSRDDLNDYLQEQSA